MKYIYKHPTHLKISSYIGGLILVFVLVSFGAGIYLQQNGQIELSHKFALSFLINSGLLISWLFFRTKLCKCPSCGNWLSKLAAEDTLKPRKFICQKCSIAWDS
jgi:hypothetical protein